MALLPPGVSSGDFAAALKEFRAAIGQTWVFTEENQELLSYRDMYSPSEDDAFSPSAALAPASVAEVQKIVKIANTYGIPLWTFSTGRNFAYGGPGPRLRGCVALDLKRMNKIVDVNEKFAYAVVEPGVSYMDLFQHLKKNDIPLWIDCAAPAWGSVMGNAVDRGAGYTPYGDHFMMQCGFEVVLADGSLIRTGMGALPNNNTWQLFKYGYGPYLDGMFTQSNFGIVTKMGIWLMPKPSGYRPYMVTFENEDDLHQITEIVRPFKINMVIPNAATTTGVLWDAAVSVSRAQYYTGSGPVPPKILRKIADDQKSGMWNFYAALYGPEPMMDLNWTMIRDAFGKVKGAKFYTADDRKGDPAFEYRAKLMRGEPNMTEFGVLNWTGGGGHVAFSPILPTTGEDATKQYRIVRDLHHKYGFDYIGEFLVGWREMHHILMLSYDRTDLDQRKRAHELLEAMIANAAKAGYGEYRAHIAFMDQIAATYNWNDGALWKLHERIKDALDPNGILSPGKSGIWPKRMRKKPG